MTFLTDRQHCCFSKHQTKAIKHIALNLPQNRRMRRKQTTGTTSLSTTDVSKTCSLGKRRLLEYSTNVFTVCCVRGFLHSRWSCAELVTPHTQTAALSLRFREDLTHGAVTLLGCYFYPHTLGELWSALRTNSNCTMPVKKHKSSTLWRLFAWLLIPSSIYSLVRKAA